MKLDREYFDNYTWDYTDRKGQKFYSFKKINEQVGSYEDGSGYSVVFFELGTNERIGSIVKSDNRTNWKSYYNAHCEYGWDGKKKTKKDFWKGLCTRADYSTAYSLLIEEYYSRK